MLHAECLDPFSAIGLGRRHEIYRALADEGPVQKITLPSGTPAWLATGHADVRRILTDPRLVKAPSPSRMLAERLVPDLAPGIFNHVLQHEPPDHTRMRRLVGAAFTHRRVEQFAPRVQQIADGLLDAVGDSPEIDLVPAYAYPLPLTAICDLIGVPDDARTDIRDWSATVLAGPFAERDAFVTAVEATVGFCRGVVDEKRRHPADDLLSALVAVRDGEDRLSEDELTSMVMVLIVAGHETTVNLIGNGVLALLTHPDQLARLRADPSLMAPAVEELLRFDGPVQVGFPMRTLAPVEIGGVDIPAGQIVIPGLLAANRDPALVARPDELDLGRPHNHHVALGYGVHHCLGASLARLEGRIALSTLLARYPRLRLAVPPEELERNPNFLMHGLATLPVALR